MEITFTFGSEEIDCEELARERGLCPKIDKDGNVTITYVLSNEDLKNLEELKKLRMDLLGILLEYQLLFKVKFWLQI